MTADLLLNEKQVFDELGLRVRQVSYARAIARMGIEKLRRMKPAQLTVNQALECVRLGLVEERKALGIPEEYRVQGKTADEFTGDDLRALAGELITLWRRPDGTYADADGGGDGPPALPGVSGAEAEGGGAGARGSGGGNGEPAAAEDRGA